MVRQQQQQRWAAQDAPGARGSAPPSAPAPATAPMDMKQQLELLAQLNELREAGALTEAEFSAKKAQILGT